MDNFHAVVIGAAAAAIGTVLAYKFINRKPFGGPAPRQPDGLQSFNARSGQVTVIDPPANPMDAAPVIQVSPNQEAAFNTYPIAYEPAFGGTTNQPGQEEILPV